MSTPDAPAKAAQQEPPHATLQDLPTEVLLHGILPQLPPSDLISLSAVDKELNALANDSTVWKAKTEQDFGYRASALSLAEKDDSKWFRRVYLGLQRPRVYVWGENSGSRLTSLRWFDHDFGDVAWPADITNCFTVPSGGGERVPVGLVDLQAGGWSFAARDMRGGVWVWGRLDGQGWTRRGWESAYATVEDPARLPLPGKATAIAQGRAHLLVLDTDNLIWEMRAWGMAYQHTSPQLTAPTQTGAGNSSRKAHIKQIAAGWEMSAVLSENGDIHVWFPFRADYTESCTPEAEMDGPACIDGVDGSRMLRWGKVTSSRDVVQTLDKIPIWAESFEIPEWNEAASRFRTEEEAEKVVQIACGRDFLVALKANGEVWLCAANAQRLGSWELMRHFSLPSITHISSQYTAIVAYSTPTKGSHSSRVLLARVDNVLPGIGASLHPESLPELDHLPIVQVVAGDWHWAALTSQGEMYTWGKNDRGQLGLGDMEDKTSVKRVRLAASRVVSSSGAPGDDEFVFSITAAGMHTGALVLGHKVTKEQQKLQRARVETPASPPGGAEQLDDGSFTGGISRWFHRGMPPIRIGFAGRGAYRGGPGPGSSGHLGSRGGGPPNIP